MSKQSRKEVTAAIVAHGDGEILRLRANVAELSLALRAIRERLGASIYLTDQPTGETFATLADHALAKVQS